MTSEKREAAQHLAKLHGKSEPHLLKAFLLASPDEDNNKEPIKLLEVVENAVEAGIMPVFFNADSKNHVIFSSVLIELSPSEYEQYAPGPIRVHGEDWTIVEQLETA